MPTNVLISVCNFSTFYFYFISLYYLPTRRNKRVDSQLLFSTVLSVLLLTYYTVSYTISLIYHNYTGPMTIRRSVLMDSLTVSQLSLRNDNTFEKIFIRASELKGKEIPKPRVVARQRNRCNVASFPPTMSKNTAGDQLFFHSSTPALHS
jgi:hypothetical protein